MADGPAVRPAAAYEHNRRPISADAFYAIACDPRRHVAVEACAGAGKTWMLVSRIVRILFDGLDQAGDGAPVLPHEILAITFTKRAAGEMRERLVRWLGQFACASEDELVAELRLRGVPLGTDAQVRAAAQRLSRLYADVLAKDRPVQIRTFHSWFAALLRAAPMSVLQQLGLPLHYELLEDDEAAKALVWRRFYAAVVAQPPLRADFEAVVRAHGRSQTEKALSMALDKRVEFALADAGGHLNDSVRHFHDLFPELASRDEPALALGTPGVATRWLAWARQLAAESTKTPRKAAELVVDAFASEPPMASTQRLALLRSAFFVASEDRLSQHLAKFDAAQQAAGELGRLCAATRQHEAWQHQQHMLRLTRVLVDEFAGLKRDRGWIDMTDVERGARVLLSDPVLSGWVQERLDNRLRHVLIDEFQDTNPLQWQALMSWLGSYSGAGNKAPSVFIVGDPKQSIYRFRRAEPQVFRAAQAFVVDALGGELLSCDHTRRNAPEVIDVVNAAMAHAAQNDGYEGFRPHTTDSAEHGMVWRLPPIRRPARVAAARTGSADTWRDSLMTARELPEETLRNLEARQVAQAIADAVRAGCKAADVMVLARRRAALMPLQDELRQLQIAAQVGEKTALIDCCEVQDIVALLDFLVSTHHDLSLARVLRSPLFALADDALVELAQRRRASSMAWFDLLLQDWPADHSLHGIGATLARWKSWLDRLPPHDALQRIYSEHDVLARFAALSPAAQRESVLANLRSLLSASLEVSGGRFLTPYAFVRAMKAGGVLAPAVVAPDAVRLLTIHGAKGLEAQLVVLIDTDTPPRAAETMGVLVDWPAEAAAPRKFVFLGSESRPPLCAVETLEWEKAQRQREELNALYVAITRARRQLVVSSIEAFRDAPGSWWQRLAPIVPEAQERPPVPAAPRPAETAPSGASESRSAAVADAAMFRMRVLPQAPAAAATSAAPVPSTRGRDATSDSAQSRVGRAMHRLLEWRRTDAASAVAVAREFALEPQLAERARGMAHAILTGPGAWVWDPEQLAWQANEVELVHHGVTMRLDRLVQRRDDRSWWVLDYKSALAPQHDAALVAQLRAYGQAVGAVYPQQAVRAAFLAGDGSLAQIELGRAG